MTLLIVASEFSLVPVYRFPQTHYHISHNYFLFFHSNYLIQCTLCVGTGAYSENLNILNEYRLGACF